MSQQNQPLSHAEEVSLNDLFKKLGWVSTTRLQDDFRYSANVDKICCLTARKNVTLPVRTFKPWAVVSFKSALAFQIRFLNEETYNLLNFVTANLQNVTKKAQLEHNFFLEGLEGKLVRALEDFVPDGGSNDFEQTFSNLLRVNLLNKYSKFGDIHNTFIAELPNICKQAHIKPTFSLPWELKEGYPPFRHENSLFFTNEEQDEYLIVEPGYLTFFHDVKVNRVLVRSFFESHSPYILLAVWKEMDFKLADVVTAWIQFARQQLTNLTAIVEFQDFDKNLLQDINLEKKLLERGMDAVFPLSALSLDSRMAGNIAVPDWRLLNNPPVSFDELEVVHKYQQSIQASRLGKYRDAITFSIDALKGFNRFGQKQGVLLTLLNLSYVAKKGRRLIEAEKYLRDALEICKTGEIADNIITQVQEMLGKVKLLVNQPADAIDHFEIATHFLEARVEKEPELQAKIAKLKLKLLRGYIAAGNFTQAKLALKGALSYAKDHLKNPNEFDEFMVLYYVEDALLAEKRENSSQAILALRKAAALEKKVTNKRLLFRVHFNLARLILIHRKNGQFSLKALQKAEEILSEKKEENIPKLIQVYELMSDAYELMKDGETARSFSKRAADLRRALQIRESQPHS